MASMTWMWSTDPIGELRWISYRLKPLPDLTAGVRGRYPQLCLLSDPLTNVIGVCHDYVGAPLSSTLQLVIGFLISKMSRDPWSEKVADALGKDGIDLERRGREAGKWIANVWKSASKVARDLKDVFTHEDRLKKVEEDTKTLACAVIDVKIWIQDVDIRTQLLEHYHDYDLEKIRCRECGNPMRVKRNGSTGEFFLGCTAWKTHGCKGSRPISGPDLEVIANEYRAS